MGKKTVSFPGGLDAPLSRTSGGGKIWTEQRVHIEEPTNDPARRVLRVLELLLQEVDDIKRRLAALEELEDSSLP